LQAALPSARSILEAQQTWNENAFASYQRAMQQFTEDQRQQLANAFAGIDIGLATDVTAGLEYIVEPLPDDVELDLPDGLLGVPVVVANLSPATRGNVLLHLVALVLATSFYAEALAEEANGRAAFLHLIAILIENYFFYCAVLDAIEEAEDELAGGAE
jgi:hypothetical protein